MLAAGGGANVRPETSSRRVSGPRLTNAATSSSTTRVAQPRAELVRLSLGRRPEAGRGRVRAEAKPFPCGALERGWDNEPGADAQRARIRQVVERLDAFHARVEAHRDL